MTAADRRRIRELKHRYCYTVDEGTPEEWAALFTDDAVFESARGVTYRGRDAILDYKRQDSPADDWIASAHMVSNPVIEVDGGTASGRWYYVWLYENDVNEIGWGQGRYDDEYRETDVGWRLSAMTITHRINAGFGYE